MAASVVQVSASTPLGGANAAINVFHIGCSGIQAPAEVNSLLNVFKTFWDALAVLRSQTLTVTTGSKVLFWEESWWTKPTYDGAGRVLTPGSFNTPPIILAGTPSTSAAGAGGALLPQQLAVCISWRSIVASKSSRGRTFLGANGANTMQANLLLGTTVTAINSAAAALITGIAGVTSVNGPLSLGVWSPKLGKMTPVVAGSTDNVYDTMRSRIK